DRDSAGPVLMDIAFEQDFDLGRLHVDELLGGIEDVSHAHAHEDVALGVIAFTGLEIALVLFLFRIRLERRQNRLERLRRRRAHDGLTSASSASSESKLIPIPSDIPVATAASRCPLLSNKMVWLSRVRSPWG